MGILFKKTNEIMKKSPGWGLFLKKSISDLGSKLASFPLRRNWFLFLAEAGFSPGSFLLFFLLLSSCGAWVSSELGLSIGDGKKTFFPLFFVAAGSFI